jgi:hypothetical protein
MAIANTTYRATHAFIDFRMTLPGQERDASWLRVASRLHPGRPHLSFTKVFGVRRAQWSLGTLVKEDCRPARGTKSQK